MAGYGQFSYCCCNPTPCQSWPDGEFTVTVTNVTDDGCFYADCGDISYTVSGVPWQQDATTNYCGYTLFKPRGPGAPDSESCFYTQSYLNGYSASGTCKFFASLWVMKENGGADGWLVVFRLWLTSGWALGTPSGCDAQWQKWYASEPEIPIVFGSSDFDDSCGCTPITECDYTAATVEIFA